MKNNSKKINKIKKVKLQVEDIHNEVILLDDAFEVISENASIMLGILCDLAFTPETLKKKRKK